MGACPRGSADFRQEQCSRYDSERFEGRLYRWVPYLKAPRKCELNCMPRGERFYYRHARTVVDGTGCDLGDGARRVCVAGDCRPVGCDGLLGSTAREDKCRVCGGDGSGCATSEGTLEEKVKGGGDFKSKVSLLVHSFFFCRAPNCRLFPYYIVGLTQQIYWGKMIKKDITASCFS